MTKTHKINRTCCDGKIAYLTKGQASEQAKRNCVVLRETMIAYECEVCGYYHLGHPGKRKPEAKR